MTVPAFPLLPSGAPTRLVQLAYRVPDLEAGCRAWARNLGVGPFLVRRNMLVKTTHRGAAAAYDHSAAFGQWGPVMLELIEVHECFPDTLRDVIEHDSVGQLHHAACFVEDLDATSGQLQADGVELVMEVESSTGIRTHFLDTRATSGCLLELYSPTPHLQALYDKVAALAVGWDGRDPVRLS
jgi:hypothetical protein